MAIKAILVKQLIEDLATLTGEHLDYPGFDNMSHYIHNKRKKKGAEISQKYLYETYKRITKEIEEGKVEVKVYIDKMDIISQILGYPRFLDYAKKMSNPIDPALTGCIGKWWSIVRANNGEYILKAPVRISLEDNQSGIIIELQGGQKLFKGTVMLRAGNIFCELDTGKDKKLYVVMKVGTSEYPRLLQGTFAGISSAGDPIAGRELFLREEKMDFEEMKWEKLTVGNNPLDDRINHYFSEYGGNCIKINNVSTFSMSDLDYDA